MALAHPIILTLVFGHVPMHQFFFTGAALPIFAALSVKVLPILAFRWLLHPDHGSRSLCLTGLSEERKTAASVALGQRPSEPATVTAIESTRWLPVLPACALFWSLFVASAAQLPGASSAALLVGFWNSWGTLAVTSHKPYHGNPHLLCVLVATPSSRYSG